MSQQCFPGCTEEVCVPILGREYLALPLTKISTVATVPERINPGDKDNTL
jgi:UDP-N-acetyl-D-mannosaminuronate dehydrogenase